MSVISNLTYKPNLSEKKCTSSNTYIQISKMFQKYVQIKNIFKI